MSDRTGKGWTEVLDCFLRYYQKVCLDYVLTNGDSFSKQYFLDWYCTEGQPEVERVRRNLLSFCLDDRVQSFVNLYTRYITAAQERGDEDLLLENLFAVPEQMEKEFSAFGFLQQEVVTILESQEFAWEDDTDFCFVRQYEGIGNIEKNNKSGADFSDGPLIYLVNGGEDIGINIEQHGFAFIAAC